MAALVAEKIASLSMPRRAKDEHAIASVSMPRRAKEIASVSMPSCDCICRSSYDQDADDAPPSPLSDDSHVVDYNVKRSSFRLWRHRTENDWTELRSKSIFVDRQRRQYLTRHGLDQWYIDMLKLSLSHVVGQISTILA